MTEENFSVDTKEDLLNVIEVMKKDKLINKYIANWKYF